MSQEKVQYLFFFVYDRILQVIDDAHTFRMIFQPRANVVPDIYLFMVVLLH